jgi:outer membrane protein insertion porin family
VIAAPGVVVWRLSSSTAISAAATRNIIDKPPQGARGPFGLANGETSRLQLSSVSRFVAACLLAMSVAAAAFAQQPAPASPARAAPAPSAPGQTAAPAIGGAAAPQMGAGVIQAINVTGNQRIEAGTIRSYILVRPGDPFDPDRLDRSVKTLYSTGLFKDVQLSRLGNVLIVTVSENPLVNKVAFEGNKRVSDDTIRPEIQTRPRAVFTQSMIEADRQKILDLYAKKGNFDATVEPRIIRQDQNRVDVVFQITDGPSVLISKIAIVGNHAFTESQLIDAISSRESRWWRFLSSSDQYDPERLNYDRELLRRFYLKNGYADIEVLDATAELSPDHKGFFLNFTVKEGERYKLGDIAITSQIKGITPADLKPVIEIRTGDWYDGDAVGRGADAIEEFIHNRGYAFVEVKPRIKKIEDKHLVDVLYEVGEGPRVFIERIDITGNTRTKDKVIRREFRLAEGDAFNAELIRKTKTRLTDLGYFSGVEITTAPGTAPDKAIVTTRVVEKATGELSFGGGFSTDAGALLDIGLAERNMVGTGIDASINGVLAQKRSSVNLAVTDPYFLDRNLVAGFDLFLIQTNYLGTEPYDERRAGGDVRIGYDFNEHLRQVWSYSLVNREVFDVATTASEIILNEAGYTLLSQVSQVTTLDYRDSRTYPHSGWAVDFGTDYAGLGGSVDYVRLNVAGAYYIPLERLMGDADWGIKLSAGTGYMIELPGGKDEIIDRFFLGGDNLRGFQTGGAGPHDANTGDPLGGRFLWTESQELRYPIPGVPKDIGITGRAFIDVGALSQATFRGGNCSGCTTPVDIAASAAPRIGAGVGISWRTQFGLINIDLAPFVVKQAHDELQIFRFGFGTRF